MCCGMNSISVVPKHHALVVVVVVILGVFMILHNRREHHLVDGRLRCASFGIWARSGGTHMVLSVRLHPSSDGASLISISRTKMTTVHVRDPIDIQQMAIKWI